jgi:hypothetical protein
VNVSQHRIRRAFADAYPIQVHAAHARLSREGYELHALRGACSSTHLPAAQAVLLFGQDHDAAALRCFIRQGGQLDGFGQLLLCHPIDGDEIYSLSVAERNRTGLIQQKHIHVAGSFYRPPGQRDDVALDHAIHAGDANRRKQATNGGRNQADQ